MKKKMNLIKVEATPIARPALETDIQRVQEAFFRGRNADTIRSDKTSLGIFSKFLGVGSFTELCQSFLGHGLGAANLKALEFKNWLVEQKKAPSTINRRLGALGSLARSFRFVGAIQWEPDILMVPVESYRDTAGPGSEQFRKALEAVSQRPAPGGVRDHAIFVILHDAALRCDELASLDLEHVDFERHLLWVQAKKRQQRESVRIGVDVEAEIRKWIEVRGNAEGALFKNFDRAGKAKRLTTRSIGRMSVQYGFGHVHGIRHLAITEHYEATKDILATMRFARHRDPKTTMAYIDNFNKMASDAPEILAKVRKGAATPPVDSPKETDQAEKLGSWRRK